VCVYVCVDLFKRIYLKILILKILLKLIKNVIVINFDCKRNEEQ